MSAWEDPMREPFDKTAASDAALHRVTRDKYSYRNAVGTIKLRDGDTPVKAIRRARGHTEDGAYPLRTQVEASDDFGRFAAACAMLGALVVMGWFLLVPILRKIFG